MAVNIVGIKKRMSTEKISFTSQVIPKFAGVKLVVLKYTGTDSSLNYFCSVFDHIVMNKDKGKKQTQSNPADGASFEKAMNDAFSQIFQNLKEIKEDTKKQREKIVDLERRRGSAPALLKRPTESLQEPKKQVEFDRSLSSPFHD